MIITRTPLRISFVGGGSDLPAWYTREPGMVVSAAIDKYMYVTLSKRYEGDVRLCYSVTETVEDASFLSHDRARECLRLLGVRRGIEIHSCADVPAGTGLGSSSAYTVGLVHAVYAHQRRAIAGPHRLAEIASEIEIERCGAPIGKQDQYASAYGGLLALTFHADAVQAERLALAPETPAALHDRLMLFQIGRSRSADTLLYAQTAALRDNPAQADMRRIVELAHSFRAALEGGDMDALGHILHMAWCHKRRLASGISTAQIDDAYMRALRAGALGGKLCGAGGGGFLLLYASPSLHAAITRALPELRRVPFGFDVAGSTVIYGGDGCQNHRD